MFTSTWYALLFVGTFGILLALTWAQATERGNHDGWFEAMDELRSSYNNAWSDGFDDAHKMGRNLYDTGYDDGYWEAFADGRSLGYEIGYDEGWDDNKSGVYSQYEIERERGLAGSDTEADEDPRAELIVQITTPDDAGYTVEEVELAELLAAERLQRALA